MPASNSPHLRKIPAKPKTKQKNFALSEDVITKLDLYKKFCERHAGSEIQVSDLVSNILDQFMDSDKSFKKYAQSEKLTESHQA